MMNPTPPQTMRNLSKEKKCDNNVVQMNNKNLQKESKVPIDENVADDLANILAEAFEYRVNCTGISYDVARDVVDVLVDNGFLIDRATNREPHHTPTAAGS